MSELLNKHTVKIQLTAALVVIGFVIYWTFIGAGYAKELEANSQAIEELKPEVRKIPLMEANIGGIKSDILEIKQDVKLLLRQK